jgi:hypothetical protein
LQGGEWVAREIVKDVQSGRAKFVVNSGDVVWWGNQGLTAVDSPYWKRVNDTMLKQLPPPDDEMRAAGLDGRWFIGIGNHEVWGDPKIQGTLSTVPYLTKLGVTPERLIYKFDFNGVRFIFLWSGKYDYRSPSMWDADRPKYAEQMKQERIRIAAPSLLFQEGCGNLGDAALNVDHRAVLVEHANFDLLLESLDVDHGTFLLRLRRRSRRFERITARAPAALCMIGKPMILTCQPLLRRMKMPEA